MPLLVVGLNFFEVVDSSILGNPLIYICFLFFLLLNRIETLIHIIMASSCYKFVAQCMRQYVYIFLIIIVNSARLCFLFRLCCGSHPRWRYSCCVWVQVNFPNRAVHPWPRAVHQWPRAVWPRAVHIAWSCVEPNHTIWDFCFNDCWVQNPKIYIV